MSVLNKSLLAIAFVLPSLAHAESTITQPVKSVFYDAAANFLYVDGNNAWGPTGCPGAKYIQVSSAVAGAKQLLTAVLAAQASGKTVRFQGTCSANPNYFDATYIEVS